MLVRLTLQMSFTRLIHGASLIHRRLWCRPANSCLGGSDSIFGGHLGCNPVKYVIGEALAILAVVAEPTLALRQHQRPVGVKIIRQAERFNRSACQDQLTPYFRAATFVLLEACEEAEGDLVGRSAAASMSPLRSFMSTSAVIPSAV